jgi:phosphatidate cytidylyltransferase
MKARVITAVLGIAFIVFLVWLGGWVFTAASLGVALLCFWEYRRMMEQLDLHIYNILSFIVIAVMVLASGFHDVPVFFAVSLLSFIALLFLILFVEQEDMQALFYTVLGDMYIGLGMGSLSLLRGDSGLLPQGAVSMDSGIFLIMFILIGTWSSDSFAFLVGRRYGKKKMAPHISPNKTVEGLLGGIVGCVILSLVFGGFFGFPLLHSLILGLLISIVAPVGDLFESYIKRVCDLKDSGQILPGHGGMLDRFDSLLFVAPVSVAFLILASRLS